MMNRLNAAFERFLHGRGLVLPQVRQMVRNQVYLSLAGTAGSMGFMSWPATAGFAVGAALGTFNFYFLARLIQELVYIKKGAVTPLLFSFYIRLAVTGLVLLAAMVMLRVNIYALLAGLSVILLNILIFGATLVGQKFKEA